MEVKAIMQPEQGAMEDVPSASQGQAGGPQKPEENPTCASEDTCAHQDTESPECGGSAASPGHPRPAAGMGIGSSSAGGGEQAGCQSQSEMVGGQAPGPGPQPMGSVQGPGSPKGMAGPAGFQPPPRVMEEHNPEAAQQPMGSVQGPGSQAGTAGPAGFQPPPQMMGGLNPGAAQQQMGPAQDPGLPEGMAGPAGFQPPPQMMGGLNPGAAQQQMGPAQGPGAYFAHTVHHPGSYGPPGYDPPIGGPRPWPLPGAGHHQGCFFPYAPAYGYPHHVPHPPIGAAPSFSHAPRPHPPVGGAPHHAPFAEVVGKALQGQATPQELISGLLNLDFRDDQFWKGVVVGSVAALLFNSDTVRQALAGALGGALGKPKEKTQSED